METLPVLKAVVGRVLGRRVGQAISALARQLRTDETKSYWSNNVASSYCYGVWLKHLVLLQVNGMSHVPASVGEFGPGDSLGVGLCALLSGSDRYSGFDVADFTQLERDRAFVDQLAALISARAPRPDRGWPDFDAHLGPGLFPHDILSESTLQKALQHHRITKLKEDLAQPRGSADSANTIQLITPWHGRTQEFKPEFEMLFSHSVLQYMSDLKLFFESCVRLLRPGGWMSHQVDFSSMGLSRDWNGHLGYPISVWNFMVGRRPFAPNRKLLSEYLRELRVAGLEVVSSMQLLDDGGLQRHQLATEFRLASDEDLRCRGAFLIARKPPLT